MRLLSVWLLLVLLAFSGQAAAETVCAQVKIDIKQELTLERQVFDAMMRINNGPDALAIENVVVTVTFEDDTGANVRATTGPDDTTADFFMRADSMDSVSDVSGNGAMVLSTAAYTSQVTEYLIMRMFDKTSGLYGDGSQKLFGDTDRHDVIMN